MKRIFLPFDVYFCMWKGQADKNHVGSCLTAGIPRAGRFVLDDRSIEFCHFDKTPSSILRLSLDCF